MIFYEENISFGISFVVFHCPLRITCIKPFLLEIMLRIMGRIMLTCLANHLWRGFHWTFNSNRFQLIISTHLTVPEIKTSHYLFFQNRFSFTGECRHPEQQVHSCQNVGSQFLIANQKFNVTYRKCEGMSWTFDGGN